MNDLTISNLQSILPKSGETKPQTSDETSATPFSDYVRQSLNEVNQKMLDADQSIEDFVTGKKSRYSSYDDIHAKSRGLI